MQTFGSKADLYTTFLPCPGRNGIRTLLGRPPPSSTSGYGSQPCKLGPIAQIQSFTFALVWNPARQLQKEPLSSPRCVIHRFSEVTELTKHTQAGACAAISISWLTSWLPKQQGEGLHSLATFDYNWDCGTAVWEQIWKLAGLQWEIWALIKEAAASDSIYLSWQGDPIPKQKKVSHSFQQMKFSPVVCSSQDHFMWSHCL